MTAEQDASGTADDHETRTEGEFDAPEPIDLGAALAGNPNADVDPVASVASLADVPWEAGSAKPDPILICDNVSRRFGGLLAVDVDHLEIQRGVITALIGPNGAGKTTFFNLLTNFDKPDTGTRLFLPNRDPATVEPSEEDGDGAEAAAATQDHGSAEAEMDSAVANEPANPGSTNNKTPLYAVLGVVAVLVVPLALLVIGQFGRALKPISETLGASWMVIFATLAAISLIAGPLAYLSWLRTLLYRSRQSTPVNRRRPPVNLNGVPTHKVAALGMVRTFQLTKALSRMTCIENMKLGATGQAGELLGGSWLPFAWRDQERDIERRADALLRRFKMDHMRDEFAGTLSGGQRKLLEMARALMVEPKLVMLDEPMAGVNPALTQSLLGHITGLRDSGMTVVFVEHDMDMVQSIADWVVVMAEGRIIAEGPPASIAANQAVVDAYLGSSHDSALDLDKEL